MSFIGRIIVVLLVGVGAGALLLTSREPGSVPSAVPIATVTHVHGIAVDRTNPSRLFLATHSGLYRTSPDGAMAVQVSNTNNDFMGFAPHPTDAGIIYASGHPSGGGNLGVIVSRDDGQSWRQLSTGAAGPVDFHAMSISAAAPNVIYGYQAHQGTVQVSRDEGRTWTVAGMPPAEVYDLAASAIDADLVYAATAVGVMISRDGGGTWVPTGSQGQPATMVETTTNGFVYAFIVGTGLVRAPATIQAWSALNTGFIRSPILHLVVDPRDPNRLYAVEDTGLIKTSIDGGINWISLG